MSCTIIAPVSPNPFLHNNIIASLQSAMETAGFLDEVYPLATVMSMELNGRRGLVPVIYGQQTEKPHDYIQMFPDGSKRGLCFFDIPAGTYPIERGTPDGDLINIVVRVICTVNLKNIANRTYDFTDELIAASMLALENSDVNQDITGMTIVTDLNQVFQKYSYTFEELQSFAHPHSAFAIELTMSVPYNFSCVVPGGFDESYSPPC